MNKHIDKIKDDFSLLKAVFAGRNIMNKKNPRYMQIKMLFAAISLLASVILWAYVAWNGNGDITRSVTIPVIYSHTGSGLDTLKYTEDVTVKISGSLSALSRMNKREITAIVDLAGIAVGRYSLPVNVEIPAGVRLVSVVPPFADVELYRKQQKHFSITLKPVGPNADKINITSASIQPSSVSVNGPSEDVSKIAAIEARVPLEQLETNKTYTAELIAVDSENNPVNRITLRPSTAVISPENITSSDSIPLKLPLQGNPADGYEIYSVKLTPDSLHVKGSAKNIAAIQHIELPPLNVAGIKQNLHIILTIPRENLPAGIEIEGSDKITADITLKKGHAEKIYANVPIKIEGSKNGEKWRVSPAQAVITVSGDSALLSTVNEIPCELIADVTGVVSDSIKLPLVIKNLRKNLTITKTEPDEVTLKKE